MRSSLFRKFVAAVNEPVRFTRDSLDAIPDIGAVDLLVGEERAEAAAVIKAKLAEGDSRIAIALAEVRCVWAIPLLVEAASTAPPATRVHAARALLTMGKYTARPALVRMLRARDGDGDDRAAAVRLLAEFPKPDKELLFEVAATDPDGSARSGAADALLTVVGLDRDGPLWGEVLLGICGRLWSSLATVRDEAVAELRVVLARWEAGATGEELGLAWHPDPRNEPLSRFIADVGSDRADYRVDGLGELTGRERVHVENVVLLRLDMDRRAVRAAGRLDVRRAVEPLRELLLSAQGQAREEVQSVLHTLTR